jgi:hypothetical protein
MRKHILSDLLRHLTAEATPTLKRANDLGIFGDHLSAQVHVRPTRNDSADRARRTLARLFTDFSLPKQEAETCADNQKYNPDNEVAAKT